MGTVLRFIAALAISLAIAFAAGQMIATEFLITDEFAAVMLGHVIFGLVAIALFAVAYARARRPGLFNWTALAVAALFAGLVLLPALTDAVRSQGTSPYNLDKNLEILLAMLLPGLLLVLIQWSLVRRRWLSLREPEGAYTGWPWITTVVAAVAVLSPPGLAILRSALRQSSTDWLREINLMLALGAGAVLAVAAVIECVIRVRMLRSRAVAASRALAPDAEKWQQVFGDDARSR